MPNSVKNQIPEPRTLAEAKKLKEWLFWKSALADELNSLKENETWKLVPISSVPKDRKLVKSLMVFKVKYNSDAMVERYKARLVAQGFTQRSGIDYNETFAPVVKFQSVRVILALAVLRNAKVSQLDIKTAFLRGDLLEMIFMRLPAGLEIFDRRLVERWYAFS